MRLAWLTRYFSILRLGMIALWLLLLVAIPAGLSFYQVLPRGSEFIPFSILFVLGLGVFLDKASVRIGLFLVGLLSLFYLFKPDSISVFLDGINFRIHDASFRLRGPLPNTRKVVIVDIDDISLKELGQWPWPRSQLATVSKEILQDGALCLGFDIVFAEPDRMSLEKWLHRFQQMGLSLEQGPEGFFLDKQAIETVVFYEWENRLALKDPDFSLSQDLEVSTRRQKILEKYRQEKELEFQKGVKSGFLPFSDQATFIEMAKRSRDLFMVEVDWNQEDPFEKPLKVILNTDESLAEVFKDGRMIAGGFFHFSLDSQWYKNKKQLDSMQHKNRISMVLNKPVSQVNEVFSHLKKASQQVLNIPTIQKYVLQQGAFNIVPDASGAARYYSHLVQAPVYLTALVLKEDLDIKHIDIFDDNNYREEVVSEFLTYPSLTLTMLRVANDYDVAQAVDRGMKKGILLRKEQGFEYPNLQTLVEKSSASELIKDRYSKLGDSFFLPLDFKGDLLINFLGEGGKWKEDSRFPKEMYFPYISFSDVLQKNYPPGFFKDKYVMLGSTDPTLFDLVGSPFRAAFPGLEVHATMLDNLLSGNILHDYGDMARLFTFFAILAVGALLVLSWCYAHFWFALCLTLLLLIGIPYGAFYAFQEYHLVVEYLYLWLSLFITAVTVLLINYFFEGRERRFVVDQFSSLVSKDVLKKLKEDPKSISLEGSKCEATVFFSDLAGFTTFSEKLSTKELVQFLNNYFSPMTDIILSYQGFIDKFIGDAIMAVWGVPFDDPNHGVHACLAALKQQEKIQEIAHQVEEKYGVLIHARMGLASGEVAAALTGSNTRKNYTVLGDVVNLGARLEPACKDYGVNILVSEETHALAKERLVTRCLDKIVVKGKTVAKKVYELVGERGQVSKEKMQAVQAYEKALEMHWDRKWNMALELLEKLRNEYPDDKAVALLLQRVKQYQEKEPPEEWQGEFIRTGK